MADIEVVVTQAGEKPKIYWLPVAKDDLVSDVLEKLSQAISIDLTTSDSMVANHGERVEHTDKVRPGDRLEILQPLMMDPKEARRQRAHSRR